jgi:hypothetical protein
MRNIELADGETAASVEMLARWEGDERLEEAVRAVRRYSAANSERA